MPTPVLHIIAGPNGSGKTTLYERVLDHLAVPFVNADRIAAERWPDHPQSHAYEAAQAAQDHRDSLIEGKISFAAETVFSHESKIDLVHQALAAGYDVTLHVIILPEDLAVQRVADRVRDGGHDVPENKIRERHRRLWRHIAEAVTLATETCVYDNSSPDKPLRRVALFQNGRPIGTPEWPVWAPAGLAHL
ncbi:zeta toxin family protein [Candidatus Poriferisodalis sp.]|uniref:zeta toxin family protein n=1 Tax=Candidatus Poriferisodalis sp. TaxID=3101277 RepID=UPI003B023875